jgi:ribonuclease P protein component
MTTPRTRATFPRSARIRAKRDFDRVFVHRLRVSDRWITLLAHRGPAAHARLGIAVGKVVGPAVTRNRRKRLVREAFRRIRHELPAGTEWVVIIRPGPEPTMDQLQQSIRDLSRQLIGKLRMES